MLYNLLKPCHQRGQKHKVQLLWTEECKNSFNKSKLALGSLTGNKNENFCLSVDSSSTAVGAVLEQYSKGECIPIAFFLKKLSPSETNDSTFGREPLAAYLALAHEVSSGLTSCV